MADLVTNRAKFHLFTGDANLDAADLRVLLLKNYVIDPDDNFVADLVPGTNEITVAGYARQTLASETVTEDDTNDFAYLDATDPAFTGLASGETVVGGVLLRQVTNDSDSPVYAGYDVTDAPTNGGDMTLQFNTPANGGALKGA
ncbi:MAG: hypothetical protein ACRD3C_18665 [Vicinamibacterales bacterium]